MPHSYVVVPFQKKKSQLVVRQMFEFGAAHLARLAAMQAATDAAGVAVFERVLDPETGLPEDTLVASIGAVPVTTRPAWIVRLN
jgi:hypothetical protein